MSKNKTEAEDKSLSIIVSFEQMKKVRDPRTGRPISKSKRMRELEGITHNVVYGMSYTKEERILASKLITNILEE